MVHSVIKIRRALSAQKSQAGYPTVPAPVPAEGPRIAGLAAWTRVASSFGEIPVGLLRPHDMVRTADGTFAEIRAIRRIPLDADFLLYHPDLRPVRVPAGALSRMRPAAEAVFAPDQPIVLIGREGATRTVRARALIGQKGADWAHVDDVVFYQIDCGRPVELLSEGLRIRA